MIMKGDFIVQFWFWSLLDTFLNKFFIFFLNNHFMFLHICKVDGEDNMNMECDHNNRIRYTDGFLCEDCYQHFNKKSPEYRYSEVLFNVMVTIHNIKVDHCRNKIVINSTDLEFIKLFNSRVDACTFEDDYESLISTGLTFINRLLYFYF